jgi:hypothetical protein
LEGSAVDLVGSAVDLVGNAVDSVDSVEVVTVAVALKDKQNIIDQMDEITKNIVKIEFEINEVFCKRFYPML